NQYSYRPAISSTHWLVVAINKPSAAYSSSDGGATWTAGDLGIALNGVTADGDIDLGVGDVGNIRRSANRGVTWTTVTSNTTNPLHAVWLSGNNAVAVGDNATVVSSSNGGINWTVRTVAGAGSAALTRLY